MQAQTSVQKIKEEGNKLFGRKEYQKALESYDRALKACGDSTTEAPLLHSNKAACYMMQQRYLEQCCNPLSTAFVHCLS